ncbi:hypothetical protein [Amycolatopsis sp. TNS106]|uniref:hypothetical protein n=1 Tax=Amycolatopsis sp. TNS106 TaxID=2861750 RepID=UPI001C58B0FC|nr:hypothetical protein [Amycolatopsis sp. TNS106]
MRELSRDELSYVVAKHGHRLSAEDIRQLETRERNATVDDLMALAYALDTNPVALLTHIPIDMPAVTGGLASGLPADLDQAELRAWAVGAARLDVESRVRWSADKVSSLRVLSAHVDEQLQAAYDQLRDLGELAVQEADAPQVQVLQARIRNGEYELSQADLALALAEQQYEGLREQGR